jgi:hypothetical protein
MAASPLADDYLAYEPELEAKLRDLLPDGWAVHYLTELGDPRERQQLAPAVFFGYTGDGAEQVAGEGSFNRLNQEFHTVIAVHTAAQIEAARALRAQVGALMALLLNSADGLAGWTPDCHTWTGLEYQPGSRPRYYIGYAEFPLRWLTRISVKTTHHRNR